MAEDSKLLLMKNQFDCVAKGVTRQGPVPSPETPSGGRGCFSFGGTVQYIEESNIYLCFVVCRLKRGLVT